MIGARVCIIRLVSSNVLDSSQVRTFGGRIIGIHTEFFAR